MVIVRLVVDVIYLCNSIGSHCDHILLRAFGSSYVDALDIEPHNSATATLMTPSVTSLCYQMPVTVPQNHSVGLKTL